MAIVHKLRKLIQGRGGQTIGVHTIEKGVKVLADIEAGTENPLKGLIVSVDDIGSSTDLLGKVIGDLQKDVIVDDFHGIIFGTSKWVTGYTGWSGATEEQSGNYLALKASVPGVTGVTIKTKMSREVTLDADGICVYRLNDAASQKVTFTAYKDGCNPVSKTYYLRGITQEPKPEED